MTMKGRTPAGVITTESRKKMAPRGQAKFNMLLGAMKKECMLGLSPTATKEEAELALFTHIAERAFNPKDPVSGQLLTNLMARVFPVNKPTLPTVDLGFDPDDTPDVMSRKVLMAVGTGQIPTDIGDLFISMIKNKILIDEKSDLAGRVDLLEEQFSASPMPKDHYEEIGDND